VPVGPVPLRRVAPVAAVPARQSARAGIRASAVCRSACAVRLTATVDARTARRLGLRARGGKPIALAARSTRLGDGGGDRARTVTAPLPRAALARLRRAGRVTATVTLRLTGTATAAATRRVVLTP
jgi:hypothetical protein